MEFLRFLSVSRIVYIADGRETHRCVFKFLSCGYSYPSFSFLLRPWRSKL